MLSHDDLQKWRQFWKIGVIKRLKQLYKAEVQIGKNCGTQIVIAKIPNEFFFVLCQVSYQIGV